MKVFLFPGQGSQKKGMGGFLFDHYKDITQKADEILNYSIKDLCLHDKNGKLDNTVYTQPALFVVNVLSFKKRLAETKQKPDFLVGHSLGEYNALHASGVFDFETGLKIVKKRAQLMAKAKKGGMAEVSGLKAQETETVLNENGFGELHLANYNAPEQSVITGSLDEIIKAEAHFKKAGATFRKLNVSCAFHSPYMSETQKEFGRYVSQFTFGKLNIPVIANATALPYQQEKIKQILSTQIIFPVQWVRSIEYLLDRGEVSFEEIGAGTVLTDLVDKIRNNTDNINTPARLVGPEKVDGADPTGVPASDDRQRDSVITALNLGSERFKKEYGLKYAYVTGAMVRGIASTRLVIAMGNAGMMGYFGTGGLGMNDIDKAIIEIKSALGKKPFGMNFRHNPSEPSQEERLADLFLKHGVTNIEASAFMQTTPALVRYRLSGLKSTSNDGVISHHKIMGKISRPEVAKAFLNPAPEKIVDQLLQDGKITEEQARLSAKVPMADAICVEADSGGHTDMGVASTLMPSIIRLRDTIKRECGYAKNVFIGSAGGIGTPEAASAAFILGADFILTGSINQCTVEAGTSEIVKDLLEQMNVQDTDYAPAGDMFEMGSKVQVLKKGLFFPARANKLYDLYRYHAGLDHIDETTRKQLQKIYFKKDFDGIYQEIKAHFKERDPSQIEIAEKDPKHKMALIFRWYFANSLNSALMGKEDNKVNFQVHIGPSLGAFNQWVKETPLELWKNRHVDEIGLKLMEATALLLNDRFSKMGRIAPQACGEKSTP